MPKIVKTGDILIRLGRYYEAIVADSNVFVICPIDFNDDGRRVNYMRAEVYANQAEINTLKDLNFFKAGHGDPVGSSGKLPTHGFTPGEVISELRCVIEWLEEHGRNTNAAGIMVACRHAIEAIEALNKFATDMEEV